AKAGDDPRKRRKVVRRKPPARGYVPWDENVFQRLAAAPPEPRTSQFKVSHTILLNVLHRPVVRRSALERLQPDSHDPRPRRRPRSSRCRTPCCSPSATGGGTAARR